MNNWVLIYILIGLGIAFAIVEFYFYNKKTKEEKETLFNTTVEKIKGYVLDLIFAAEKIYQSGTGQFKKAYVINMILNGEFYKGLPIFVQKLITFELLSEIVDTIVGNVFNVVK